MVLPEARAELREALAALIAGRLSNEEFADVYERRCFGSLDRAIGEFGWGLCSNDLLPWPYYLAGPYAVPAETQAVAKRCDLFLRSGLEYEWPPEPRLAWVQFAQAFAAGPGCAVSLFAAALVPLALSNSWWGGAGVIALIAVLAFVPGLWACRCLSRYEQRRWSEFWGRGARETWPFFSTAEYHQAGIRDNGDIKG
jgi:hypothetical protein